MAVMEPRRVPSLMTLQHKLVICKVTLENHSVETHTHCFKYIFHFVLLHIHSYAEVHVAHRAPTGYACESDIHTLVNIF